MSPSLIWYRHGAPLPARRKLADVFVSVVRVLLGSSIILVLAAALTICFSAVAGALAFRGFLVTGSAKFRSRSS